MTRLLIITTLSLLFFSVTAQADVHLLEVKRKNDLDSLSLEFNFNEIPNYKIEKSGQRVDLILKNTVASPDLRSLKDDGQLIKILFAQKPQDLVVSLLLRQVPARAIIQPKTSPPRLALDLFWEQNHVRPAIAFRIAGLPTPRPGAATASVKPTSRYSGQWQQFFKSYYFPIDLQGSINFTLGAWPPPPEEEINNLPPLITQKIFKGDWNGLLEVLDHPESGTTAIASDHQKTVLRSEAFLRIGELDQALASLVAAKQEAFDGPLKGRAILLMSYLKAASGSFYQANNLLANAKPMLAADAKLKPYQLLLIAEIALATGKPGLAEKVLQGKDDSWPESLKLIRERRLFESKSGIGDIDQALNYYRNLKKLHQVLAGDTFSLACAAKVFFHGGDYGNAGMLYRRLATTLEDPSEQALAKFAAALSVYKETPGGGTALDIFDRIRQEFPGEEAGYRAKMMTLDIQTLAAKDSNIFDLVRGYGEIAAHASIRELREEAAFKEALIMAQRGRSRQSIKALRQFCQDFSSGILRPEAEALLTELLPKVIQDLMDKGDEISALILVEQNRDLLLSRGLNQSFLFDLARASSRLGLADRASKILLYLFDDKNTEVSKERFYPPLLKALWEENQFDMVESYARHYQENFPEGIYRGQVFLYHIKALKEMGKLKEAEKLLSSSNRPRNQAIDLEEARILSTLKNDEALVASAKISLLGKEPLQETLLLQAEALRRSGRPAQAWQLYQKLLEGPFGDQVLYRSAQLKLAEGEKEAGLKILRQLAEKGKEELWRKLAEENLKMANRYIQEKGREQ